MGLDEQIRKVIEMAREIETTRRKNIDHKELKEVQLRNHYFKPIIYALNAAEKEFMENDRIQFNISTHESDYAEIYLKTKNSRFIIYISCVYFKDGEKFRISYMLNVKNDHDDKELFHEYFDQGKEPKLLKTVMLIIARFEQNGYLTTLDDLAD